MILALLLAMAQATPSPAPAPVPSSAPPSSSIDGLPLGTLPRQSLPAAGCAAYLFTTGETRALAVMATADPGMLRLSLDGRVTDLARAEASGAAKLGLTQQSVFRSATATATLDLTIESRQNLMAGAMVPRATLQLDRPGQDTLVIPLAGLVGCRA